MQSQGAGEPRPRGVGWGGRRPCNLLLMLRGRLGSKCALVKHGILETFHMATGAIWSQSRGVCLVMPDFYTKKLRLRFLGEPLCLCLRQKELDAQADLPSKSSVKCVKDSNWQANGMGHITQLSSAVLSRKLSPKCPTQLQIFHLLPAFISLWYLASRIYRGQLAHQGGSRVPVVSIQETAGEEICQ